MKTIHTCHKLLSTVPKAHLRDAQFLLSEILGKSVADISIQPKMVVTNAQAQLFIQGVTELNNGKPLAYVVGHQPFWSLNFFVNEHTLIPRPDTEHLIEQSLAQGDLLENIHEQPIHALDLGTGSGAIAICIKHERPSWHITATDFSMEALAVARKNAKLNQTDVQFLQGSWFEAVDTHTKYHLIISNPPYIAPDDEHLPNLTHEPITALVADNNGMADIREILANSVSHLYEQGWLLVEHGYNQGEAVREFFLAHGFQQVQTIHDYGGNERVTKGQFKP